MSSAAGELVAGSVRAWMATGSTYMKPAGGVATGSIVWLAALNM